MQVVDNTVALRTRIKTWRANNELIAFVPTMGNLHEGHLSLVQKAKALADRIVVSIYVNPLQFNDKNDLEKYPRTLTEDINLLSEQECDLVFTPDDSVVYPQGMSEQTSVHVPGMDDKLCGLGRPGHFDGVATVVTKLFNMVQADIAVFGEKDYQQLLLIKKLVADLNIPIDVVGAPTRREDSGLAMSSRNNLLSDTQRLTAPLLYQQLMTIRTALENGETDLDALTQAAQTQLRESGFEPEYLDIRRADDLRPAQPGDRTALRILVAARLGSVRLIDNILCDLA
ncbi:pantoate--beta-alanine ligase [Methylophaga sp.]|jgi:pantoate--beta-alanine ligase|uniref:pantoate--beta-alanine ligase n=1 Tax=Methylophaga sp. TaxID=2024840 RepID=UPI0013FF001B|nr:pantoate--beta-alanine ligase [Methylophaga sp.]MTI64116.1 pantoate--beta-alanine ligase [Methylophaga sp.]